MTTPDNLHPAPDRGRAFARLLADRRDGLTALAALIMGIVNVTPDSFSDGGRFDDAERAVAHARALVAQGADLVDVGGESTRPGATPVPQEEELRRILPVIAALTAETIVSVDTAHAAVADAALAAGAHVINDITGLQGEPQMAQAIAAHGAGVVIMHNSGMFGSSHGTEGDPVLACMSFFEKSLGIAARAGIATDRIVLDPGFGFGKSVEQSLQLLARIDEFAAIGLPILIGTSRKTFIGRVTGGGEPRPVDDRLAGTLATNIVAVQANAAIVRVHDVAEHADALRMLAAIRNARPEAQA
ncbi:dihydropteroate synthase [Faunimonas pinastri]|uniref:Dihydropteroate synthase n=1 Tax=Faunimonas pinastri TaxID=1855383 RepID=A0A1H8ZFK3_9HYPH|nr:dihydropteroate synthase [Faunimonas pinastri]